MRHFVSLNFEFSTPPPSQRVIFFPIGLEERGFVDDGALYWAGGLGGVGVGFADGVAGG